MFTTYISTIFTHTHVLLSLFPCTVTVIWHACLMCAFALLWSAMHLSIIHFVCVYFIHKYFTLITLCGFINFVIDFHHMYNKYTGNRVSFFHLVIHEFYIRSFLFGQVLTNQGGKRYLIHRLSVLAPTLVHVQGMFDVPSFCSLQNILFWRMEGVCWEITFTF